VKGEIPEDNHDQSQGEETAEKIKAILKKRRKKLFQ
jgi:hypothetical protein